MQKVKRLLAGTAALACLFGVATTGFAHFGTLIPSDDIVSGTDNKTLQLKIKFLHPMEGHYMEMVKPQQFGVLHDGKKTDLLATLVPAKGKSADQSSDFTYWETDYKIKRPGDYTFYVQPTPYWEPAEDIFIVHYTKVCVNALGLEKGWDEPVGLETEIIPLTRPYGLWTGNMFTGKVLVNGQPAAGTDVEVEYLNEAAGKGGMIHPPSDPFVTQVVKTDANGLFSYAMPKAGWWGFSALSESSEKIKKDGADKNIEIGAVYWLHTIDLQ